MTRVVESEGKGERGEGGAGGGGEDARLAIDAEGEVLDAWGGLGNLSSR